MTIPKMVSAANIALTVKVTNTILLILIVVLLYRISVQTKYVNIDDPIKVIPVKDPVGEFDKF